jgi:hypothetical protein
MPKTKAWEIAMVRTKNVRNRIASSVVSLAEEVRGAAAELVRREEYRVGSRMLAYENVGAMVGASGAWVRKFVKGYAEVGISFPVGMNIIASYRRVCERIEADADRRLGNARAATASNSKVDQGLDSRANRKEALDR